MVKIRDQEDRLATGRGTLIPRVPLSYLVQEGLGIVKDFFGAETKAMAGAVAVIIDSMDWVLLQGPSRTEIDHEWTLPFVQIFGDPQPEERELELRIYRKLGLDVTGVRRAGPFPHKNGIPWTIYQCKSSSRVTSVRPNCPVEWHELSRAKSLLAGHERRWLINAISARNDS